MYSLFINRHCEAWYKPWQSPAFLAVIHLHFYTFTHLQGCKKCKKCKLKTTTVTELHYLHIYTFTGV